MKGGDDFETQTYRETGERERDNGQSVGSGSSNATRSNKLQIVFFIWTTSSPQSAVD